MNCKICKKEVFNLNSFFDNNKNVICGNCFIRLNNEKRLMENKLRLN